MIFRVSRPKDRSRSRARVCHLPRSTSVVHHLADLALWEAELAAGPAGLDAVAAYANAARQRAHDYEMGTPGRRINPQTGQSSVPRLSMPGRDGDVTTKFDGLCGDEIIDRKNGVLPWTSDSMVDEARRQSATSAYHGLQAVWEVPNHTVATCAQGWLNDAGVSNINVRVAP